MSRPKPEWCLGIEWFRNDTGKEFDGAILMRADKPEFFNEIAKNLADTIKEAAELEPSSLTPERQKLVKSGLYWFHVFHKPTLDKMPKRMFDAVEEVPVERSFEEIMGDAGETLADPSSQVSNDLFFNRHGDPINGMPDYWMLQAGLE